MSLQVGQPAPDFDLPSSTGERVTLSGLRGQNVVVMFFPFAFTGICTGEVCALSEGLGAFGDLDAAVVSISCDATPTLTRFAEQEGLSYPLLSDFWPHGEVSRAYGVFLDHIGAANRGTFIVDREGNLAWSVVTALGEPRDAAEYTKVLQGLA